MCATRKKNIRPLILKREAASLIQEIHGRGICHHCRGTGLYLKALLENYHFSTSEEQTKRRQALADYADRYGNEALHQKLEKLDEETANRLKINDRRRIIRAIEAWEDGDPVSQEKDSESPFDAVVFGLTMERALLYDRINRRVDLMVEEGLFDEARFFYDKGSLGFPIHEEHRLPSMCPVFSRGMGQKNSCRQDQAGNP